MFSQGHKQQASVLQSPHDLIGQARRNIHLRYVLLCVLLFIWDLDKNITDHAGKHSAKEGAKRRLETCTGFHVKFENYLL